MIRVKTDGLNLRTEPRAVPETRIVSLPLAHPVTVLGDAEREGWKEIEVEIEGAVRRGVVAGRFLRESESEPKERLLAEAIEEWIRFERGDGREHHAPFFEHVGEMWRSLGMSLDGKDRDVPWSAAFISFVVRNAGYHGFRFAAAHARYIHQSIVARLEQDAAPPFWGFRLSEHRPRLGDLVCQWRFDRRAFDDAITSDAFKSHCDIVVEVRDTFVRAIGGNVSQSVAMKTFSLDDDGLLKDANRVFAVLRNNL